MLTEALVLMAHVCEQFIIVLALNSLSDNWKLGLLTIKDFLLINLSVIDN